ncbi:putative sodium- and chloride-dependent GABA transporter 2-like [Scophthalmus maximus]|uniref:Putative sodium-and chloride-dependent GABA transporter 2-like n=1 Tax=Scophthalmus maximus TaxID=52904 RepID=A0A2U9BJZ9_SCOMX|nr:putative sodium- and chloride-dependent GABA transporter 2-like [Scophthalmus maximus]
MIVLLIRGVTLPGAIDGIRFYLSPDPTHLANPQVWIDAASQVLFSNVVCSGCLTSLGSHNKYNNNCYKDAFALAMVNSVTSFVAGFAIFSVLGYMSYQMGVDISAVAESGPGLAFIAYPQAVAMMPLPQLWAVFFFLMIIFLGLDSQFVNLETMVTSISDMYPSFFSTGHRRKLLLLVICVVSLLIGLCMVTEGGMYIFQLFEYYICGGIPLLLIAILETICIGWVYDLEKNKSDTCISAPQEINSDDQHVCPWNRQSVSVYRSTVGADRYYMNIMDMIGYRPSPYIKYCWRYITPCVSASVLLFSLVKFTPLRYNNTYKYPWWGLALGLFLALSSVLIVPLWCLYILTVTPGTPRQRLKVVTTPADNLLRATEETLKSETCADDKPRKRHTDEILGEVLLHEGSHSEV